MFYSSKEIKSIKRKQDVDLFEEDKNPPENSSWNEVEEEKIKISQKEETKSYHEALENLEIIK